MPNKLSAFWLYDKLIYYLVRIVRKLKGKPLDRSGYSFFEQSRHWFFSSSNIRDLVKDSGFSVIEESGISVMLFNRMEFTEISVGVIALNQSIQLKLFLLISFHV